VLEVEAQAHPQKVWFAENLGKNATKSCFTPKNGTQGLHKNTWRPFFEVTPKKGHNYLCGREFCRQKLHKNLFGHVWENSGKYPSPPKKFACCYTNDQKAPPILLPHLWKDSGGNTPAMPPFSGVPCAYYSTRALFTRCCRLQCVTVMNINHHRYPKTEQLITAKISSNALQQRSSRTRWALRQHSAQLQKYKAARMSRRIAVDQKVCYWDGEHPGLTVWIL